MPYYLINECNGVCEKGVTVTFKGIKNYSSGFYLHYDVIDLKGEVIDQNDVELGNIKEYTISVNVSVNEGCRPVVVRTYVKYKDEATGLWYIDSYQSMYVMVCASTKKISFDRSGYIYYIDINNVRVFPIPFQPGTVSLPDSDNYIIYSNGMVYDNGKWVKAKAFAVDFYIRFDSWYSAAAWALGLIASYTPRTFAEKMGEAYVNGDVDKVLNIGLPYMLKHLINTNVEVMYMGYEYYGHGQEGYVKLKFRAYFRFGSFFDRLGHIFEGLSLGCIIGGVSVTVAAAIATGGSALTAAGSLFEAGCAAGAAIGGYIAAHFGSDDDAASDIKEAAEKAKQQVSDAVNKAINDLNYLKQKYNISDDDYQRVLNDIKIIQDEAEKGIDEVANTAIADIRKVKIEYGALGFIVGVLLAFILAR